MRIQILELPYSEVGDPVPFALVVDRLPAELEGGVTAAIPEVKRQTGARGVIVVPGGISVQLGED